MTNQSGARKIKVAQFGLGPIGADCIRMLSERAIFEVVGAVDIAPAMSGKDVAEICSFKKGTAGKVYTSFEELYAAAKPDVIVHTAGSKAATSLAQCRPMLEKGLAVVSSCEELFYPWYRAKKEADEIDALCRESGGRLLGTGVNPGFIFDLLPVCLSAVCRSVKGLHGIRIADATPRREPLQRKIGCGMAPEAFEKLGSEGKVGHAGFHETLLVVTKAFGWKLKMDSIKDSIRAVVAEKEIRTKYFHVLPGQTKGMRQVIKAESEEGHPIQLELHSMLDPEEAGDTIHLESEPPIHMHIKGGLAGDIATVAALVNAIPRLLAAQPGIRLVTDIPLAVF